MRLNYSTLMGQEILIPISSVTRGAKTKAVIGRAIRNVVYISEYSQKKNTIVVQFKEK